MYLTVFRNRKRANYDAKAYAADATHLETLARAQKGFISFRRYASSDGEALSIAEWETEADARAWSRHPEHLVIQARARSDYYDSYVVYSCVEPQVRRFDRSKAPST